MIENFSTDQDSNENVSNIGKKDFVKCGVPILKHLANNSNELSHYAKNRLSEMEVDISRKIPGFGRPKDLDQIYDSSILTTLLSLIKYNVFSK